MPGPRIQNTFRRVIRTVGIFVAIPFLLFLAAIFYFANFQYGWQLVYQGDLNKVKRVVERDPKIVQSWPDDSTPLHYAAVQGRLEIV
jgi:hypothetical protein